MERERWAWQDREIAEKIVPSRENSPTEKNGDFQRTSWPTWTKRKKIEAMPIAVNFSVLFDPFYTDIHTYIYMCVRVCVCVCIYICVCVYRRILFSFRSVFGKRAISHRYMHATMYRLAIFEPSDAGTSRLLKFFLRTPTQFLHTYFYVYIYKIIYLYMYMYIVLRLRHTIMPVLSNSFYVYHTYTLAILFEEK